MEEFATAVDEAIASVRETLPPPAPSLEDEIADVSQTLTATVTRLHGISDRALAFEDEVRMLVERADAARAAAQLHEDDARRIALLLGERTEQRFRAEIAKLTVAHNEQVERLRRSGIRTAWLWGVVGVLLGFAGNVVTQLLIH